MKTTPASRPSRPAPAPALVRLRHRLAETEATLQAIRTGAVDTVVVAGKAGPQVFTLHGAEQAYRVLIESMNEGALTLTADKTILYANQCFARMVHCPLEQVIGGSLRRFLSREDRTRLAPLLKRATKSGGKLEVLLRAGDSSLVPVQLSIRPLARNGSRHAALGIVVTDMTEPRHTEELLRALTHRVVQMQEAERGRVALELHDNITQLLCALVFSSQALAAKLPARAGPAKREAAQLRLRLGEAVAEVERIAHHLRPSILDQLGLFAVLRTTCTEFAARTGVAIRLAGIAPAAALPPDTELALYRILQEALKNVEKHARARHVSVSLRQTGAGLQLVVTDDGIGFDQGHHARRRKDRSVLGLVGMRERAAYVGGTLRIKSGTGAGTEIAVRIPRPTGRTMAAASAA